MITFGFASTSQGYELLRGTKINSSDTREAGGRPLRHVSPILARAYR